MEFNFCFVTSILYKSVFVKKHFRLTQFCGLVMFEKAVKLCKSPAASQFQLLLYMIYNVSVYPTVGMCSSGEMYCLISSLNFLSILICVPSSVRVVYK